MRIKNIYLDAIRMQSFGEGKQVAASVISHVRLVTQAKETDAITFALKGLHNAFKVFCVTLENCSQQGSG